MFGNSDQNHFWKFYLQFWGENLPPERRGPIGNRLTMACSRIIMQDWGKQYSRILEEANLLVTLFKIYVDDVRQVSTLLEKGMRYDPEKRKMMM